MPPFLGIAPGHGSIAAGSGKTARHIAWQRLGSIPESQINCKYSFLDILFGTIVDPHFCMHLNLDFSPQRKYHEVMPVDPHDLRLAMRRWTTGVTVVSAAARAVRHGMTVSSFTSVSLDPPLVLVSLDRESSTHRLVEQIRSFGVSILSDDQRGISDRFAGRIYTDTDRFVGLDTFNLVTGAPLLAHSLAAFDCQVVSSFETGTQTLFIGEVLAVKTGVEGFPLIYFNQDYRSLMK